MVCVRGRAELGDVCWHPAVALAQAAHCLTRPGHALWARTGPANPPAAPRALLGLLSLAMGQNYRGRKRLQS